MHRFSQLHAVNTQNQTYRLGRAENHRVRTLPDATSRLTTSDPSRMPS